MKSLNHPIEKLMEIIIYKGVEFEIVERPDVAWVGCVAYADNNIDPPFAENYATIDINKHAVGCHIMAAL